MVIDTHTCLRSSFRLAISAAFSSLVIPAVLFVADTVGAVSALPPSEGVTERTLEPALDVPSGEATRGIVVCRVGCGATGGFGAGAEAGADVAQGSRVEGVSSICVNHCKYTDDALTWPDRLRVCIT